MFSDRIPVVRLLCVASLLLGAMAISIQRAGAQSTVYTSQSAFDALLTSQGSGTQTITFEGIAPPGGFQNVSNPFAIDGVTFTGDSNAFININDSQLFSGSGYDYGTGATMGVYENANGNTQAGANGAFTATLPSGVNAVGFDIGDFGGDPAVITLSDGESFDVDAGTPFPGSGFNFIGFVSPVDITAVTVTPTANTFGSAYDNFTFSNVPIQAVPEPSSALLISLGVLCIAALGALSVTRARAMIS